jgi:HSP90 family molecular chaperone
MRVSVLIRALVIAFIACAVIGEEAVAQKEQNAFGADVKKMLEILIRNLYVDQNVFLREVISNASDALDKIRMLYLSTPKDPKNDAGESPTMDIRISVDKDKRIVSIRDGGVGMTKDEMKANLGNIGSSGTKRFLEQMSEAQEQNLIGQFGVGFYSVFLVAERVRVASKSDDSDKQYIWESTADGTYFIYEDPRGNTLGRGTELLLELKSDADQFLENEKIKEIIHRYSEFIHFPIYLKTTKIERVPKKKDGEAAEEKPAEDEEGAIKDEGEGEEGEKKKEEEFDHVPVDSWELVNENKPIWTRKSSEVTEEEYNKFYKAFTKDYEDPMFYTHFSVEGEVEFKSLLFIPGRAPYNVFDTSVSSNNIRLFVKRVFITDEFKDLLPRYLNFVKGVVDSEDLPLNVSREQLQESKILKIIKKKLVRKALMMFADIAENDKKLEAAKDKKGEEEKETETEKSDDDVSSGKVLKEITFPKLWEEFGKNLRLGLIEDGTNRARLTKLLRYKSSKSEDKYISLQDYVDRMPESQKNIYFLTDESIERIKQAPVLEDALKRDVEVLYMVDPIDEYVVGHVTDFGGKKLVNLAKEGISVSDRSSTEKKIEKARKAKYEPLLKWFKDLLGDKVTKVTLTRRLTGEPVILSSPQHGQSARMHRLMQAQTLGEKQTEKAPKRVMEVNHLHPLINEIFKRVTVDEKDKVAEDLSLVLFDVSNLQNGFPVDDTLVFGQRVGRLLRQSVAIAPDAPLLEEDVSQYELEADEAEEGEGEEKAAGEKKDEL